MGPEGVAHDRDEELRRLEQRRIEEGVCGGCPGGVGRAEEEADAAEGRQHRCEDVGDRGHGAGLLLRQRARDEEREGRDRHAR